MTNVSTHPYDDLTPDVILDALEEVGFAVSGRLFALNSYENRVYQIGLDEGGPVIAKFYRPGRWSEAQIREEHTFTLELLEADVPVVAPMTMPSGDTMAQHGEFLFAVFPQRGGQAPDTGSVSGWARSTTSEPAQRSGIAPHLTCWRALRRATGCCLKVTGFPGTCAPPGTA